MKKLYWNIIKALTGLTILVFLYYKIDFLQVYKILIGFDFNKLPIILIATAFIFFFEILNIKILVSKLSSISNWKIIKYHVLSWSLGMFVPGRIGQFSIIYLFKKEGLSIGEGSAVVIIDKMITLFSLLVLSMIGFAVFFPLRYSFYILIMIIIAFIFFAFFILNSKGRHLIKKFILRKHSNKFEGFSKTIKFYLKKGKTRILLNIVVTFLKWGASATMMFFLFAAFGYYINIFIIYLIMPAGVLVSFIPISISGLGIRESTAVFLYSQIGFNPIIIAGAYLVNLIINYIIAAMGTILFLDALRRNETK